MTNAEVVASELARSGVERVFGVPGGEVVLLLEACRRAGIRFYLTGHEAAAAFMADVTGQLSGLPGVCLATLGPGAVNLGLGVANALLDRSPVVALTAQVPASVAPHFSHQRLPLDRFFGSLCKASVSLNGDGAAETIQGALALAADPPPGPVHVAVPSDVAAERARPGRTSMEGGPRARRRSLEGLAEVAALLAEARRPLLVAGVGCTLPDVPALRLFVDRAQLPFVLTPKAKGVLPEDAPGFLGVVGGMALDRAVMENVDEADLLLGIGFDPVECDKDWYLGRNVANLTRWRTAEGGYRPVEVLGEVGELLATLASSVGPAPWPPELLARCRARLRPVPRPGRMGLSPLEALASLRDVVPPEAILTCDVGSHKYLAGQWWPCREPHTFLVSNGLSAMGYAVPAAIAAKLHAPHRPVLALVGDGGFLMTLYALTCAVQYRVPVTVVCLVDGSLSLIRVAQRRRGLGPHGVDFPAPDFAAVARGFGVEGVSVGSCDELRLAVARALSRSVPAVVSVPVEAQEYEVYC